MTLSDYDVQVSKHLQFIETGADMAARHARMLLARPDFATKAEDELAKSRATLERALENIKSAQATYQSKALESA